MDEKCPSKNEPTPARNVETNQFSRSWYTRKVMLAQRRRRLGSIPSKFVQTDDELESDNARHATREWKSLTHSVDDAKGARERTLSETGINIPGINRLKYQVSSFSLLFS
ncbi:hypothetical protein ACF0H5_017336 [Mactra antiquata]